MFLFGTYKKMNENFGQLLEKSLSNLDVRPGSLIKAKVVDIQTNQIIVDACSKPD